ncbi:hypothetical protein [Occallatibacter riparius]|uniref:Uncharacterized protein n=1 Tax=Occallatibacter riparius TaxID=1002689 RepID=A0A9J7BW72_9BACT|nr:hypothetical protein [Occallatibacter riparius]UWZ86761.1 hypothetical protein MOP44_12625 [Occallatibacter riparius]
MKRSLTIQLGLVAALLAPLLSGPPASAQTSERANIPFAFFVDKQEFPAGCYKLTVESDTQLSMVNCETGKPVMLMARTTKAYQVVQHGKLVFYVSGKKARLHQALFAGSNKDTVFALPPKLQREIATNMGVATVEIAMK